MKKNKLFCFCVMIIAMLFSSAMHAQNNSLDKELYTDLHGHGSMNAVFVVIAIIFAGLFITLIRIDRKVARLENEIKERKS